MIKMINMKLSTRKTSLLFLLGLLVVCASAQYFIRPWDTYKIPPPGGDPYKKYWAEVDSLERIGLTESANKVVIKISEMAERDKNDVQSIKAFFHLAKYKDVLEEESFTSNMKRLDEMIGRSSSPFKQLLYSIKGEVVWNRYLGSMWQINQRTPILDDKETDMEKWDAKRFAREAMKCYELSMV